MRRLARTGSHCRFGCAFDEQCFILHAWFLVFACVVLSLDVLRISLFSTRFLCCRHITLALFRLRLPPLACFDTCVLQSLRCAVRVRARSRFCACVSIVARLGGLPILSFCLSMALRFDLFLHVFVQFATIVLMHWKRSSFVHRGLEDPRLNERGSLERGRVVPTGEGHLVKKSRRRQGK